MASLVLHVIIRVPSVLDLQYVLQMVQFETVSCICDVMPGQNTTSLALRLHFSMPRCELCIIFNISACMLRGIITLSPLKGIPSEVEISSQ